SIIPTIHAACALAPCSSNKMIISQPKNFDIPEVTMWQKMDEADYRMLIHCFITTNFALKLNEQSQNHHIIFPARQYVLQTDPDYIKVIEMRFKKYRKIIHEAYKIMFNKQSESIIDGDPALDLYNYIHYLRNTSFDH